ncbi:hypothetical protein NHQ30_003628 [Ciborinia camelliae]|nr:hypothetical protein NHQ30_003628 [Ciborinia camelliae]
MPPKRQKSYTETQLQSEMPTAKRIQLREWSEDDEKILAETFDDEIRIWRKVKEMYGIDAIDLIPDGVTASFLSDNGSIDVPVWTQRASQMIGKILNCPVFKGEIGLKLLHHSMNLARFYRLPPSTASLQLKPPRNPESLPEHYKFKDNIKSYAEGHNKKTDISTGITYLDLDCIVNAWDEYVEETPGNGLKTIAAYSKKRSKRHDAAERWEILEWKKKALIECRQGSHITIGRPQVIHHPLEQVESTESSASPEQPVNLEYSDNPLQRGGEDSPDIDVENLNEPVVQEEDDGGLGSPMRTEMMESISDTREEDDGMYEDVGVENVQSNLCVVEKGPTRIDQSGSILRGWRKHLAHIPVIQSRIDVSPDLGISVWDNSRDLKVGIPSVYHNPKWRMNQEGSVTFNRQNWQEQADELADLTPRVMRRFELGLPFQVGNDETY